LRLLHPFIPFVTDEIWQKVKETVPALAGDAPSVMLSEWPEGGGIVSRDENIEAEVAAVTGVISRVRDLRAKFNVKPGLELNVSVGAVEGADSEKFLQAVREGETVVKRLAKVGALTVDAGVERPADSAAAIVSGLKVYVEFGDAIDFDQERARLKKNIDKAEKDLAKSQKKLSNPKFVERAAPEAVDKERRKESETLAEIDSIKSDLAALDQ
ncbi:class I tRNA ligase family protein, partial [bacterium]